MPELLRTCAAAALLPAFGFESKSMISCMEPEEWSVAVRSPPVAASTFKALLEE